MTNPDGVVIDPQAQARLQEWGGPNLVREMIKLFLQNAPQRLEQVRKGVGDGGELKEAERGAHSLKSSAANVGAVTVSKVAAEMENLATEGKVTELKAVLPKLEAAYSLASAQLAATIGTTEAGA
jgi:two-component system sensor histidine kinase/response regulator